MIRGTSCVCLHYAYTTLLSEEVDYYCTAFGTKNLVQLPQHMHTGTVLHLVLLTAHEASMN